MADSGRCLTRVDCVSCTDAGRADIGLRGAWPDCLIHAGMRFSLRSVCGGFMACTLFCVLGPLSTGNKSAVHDLSNGALMGRVFFPDNSFRRLDLLSRVEDRRGLLSRDHKSSAPSLPFTSFCDESHFNPTESGGSICNPFPDAF